MNHFYVLNGRKIKQYLIVFVAVVFACGIIYAEKGNVSVFTQAEPTAIYSVPTDKKWIALTFDISWGEERAEPILQVLADKEVKNATFFLSSPWVKSHPDIAKKVKEAGYEIGSHGHKHTNYSALENDEIRRQIQTAHQILNEELGTAPKLIRLPNGDFDKRVLKIADELNYKVIQWHTDSMDWENPGVEAITERVLNNAHPGDIVLLHASDSSKQTHEALPIIIDELRSQGYEFVTVSQMLDQTSVEQKTVEDK